MKLYIVDDDRNVQTILKMIIRDRNLGTLCGSAANGADALEDMPYTRPDIVIVDLLMPEMDGITFVKKARLLWPDTTFIMLSQVASKDMIASAYESGIEFYIQKPINSVEVEKVIKKVEQSMIDRLKLKQVQSIFLNQNTGTANTDVQTVASALQSGFSPSPLLSPDTAVSKPHITRLRGILQKLGISGERGSRDIIQLVDYLVEHQTRLSDVTLGELCSKFSDNPKSVEQRIRRTANMGMVNLANLGLEDYSNDIFTTYANTLYNFEQVRREMDFIRGKSTRHGNVKIKSFLNALVLTCTES